MIKKISEEKYEIKSFTNDKDVYIVEKIGEKWVCSCPAFIHRKEAFPCKHIIRLTMYLRSRISNAQNAEAGSK